MLALLFLDWAQELLEARSNVDLRRVHALVRDGAVADMLLRKLHHHLVGFLEFVGVAQVLERCTLVLDEDARVVHGLEIVIE